MNISKILFISVIAAVGLIGSSCKNLNTENKKSESLSVEVVRFEQKLFSMDLYSIPDSARVLLKTYPEFSALFTNRIIEIGDTVSPRFGDNLSKFITDQGINSLHARVEAVFKDFSAQTELFSIGLSNYKHHFPEKELPTIYTYVSGLNQSIVTADKILGISLDKYLGADEPIYSKVYPPIPLYLKQSMQPVYIVPDAMRSWVVSDIRFTPLNDNFLSQVLHEARAIYITKQLLPMVSDTLLFGFTANQLKFCKESETDMWKYLVEQKMLFSTDNFRISQFINPGPFTKDFTPESPARAAVWLGYRIIDSYMSRNKNLGLSELSLVVDFQEVLNESRYNP